MTGRKVNKWGKTVYHYTDRKNTLGSKQAGCGRHILSESLEQLVWQQVYAWLCETEEMHAAIQRERTERGRSTERSESELLKLQLKKTKNGRKRLLRLLLDESLSEKEVREAMQDWKEKEAQLVQQLTDLQVEEENCHIDSPPLLQQAVEHYLTEAPEELHFTDKQELLRRIVREVKVYQDKIEIYCF